MSLLCRSRVFRSADGRLCRSWMTAKGKCGIGCTAGLRGSGSGCWRGVADVVRYSHQHWQRVSGGDAGLKLKYYIFDWDDNVVHMPTKIWMEDSTGTPLPMSTAEYARRRGEVGIRPLRGDAQAAYREFHDTHGDFKGDLDIALQSSGWQGPAFGSFKQAIMEGRLFAIVTARGHSKNTLRRGVEHFINAILSAEERQAMLYSLRNFSRIAQDEVPEETAMQRYLSLCHFVGVTSPEFLNTCDRLTPAEDGKKIAVRRFVQHVLQTSEAFVTGGYRIASISFGMSDDDSKNVQAIEAFMRDELSVAYPNVKFVMFDTGGGRITRLRSHFVGRDQM